MSLHSISKFVLCSTLTLIIAGSGQSLFGQESSINPGINDSFDTPDVKDFVERFEKEGREVYDHRQRIIEEANITAGETIADVGAGTGLFTHLLAEKTGPTGTVIAVDIAKEFVDHTVSSARTAGLNQVRGQVCKPDSVELQPNSIDVAFICDTYHHFEFPYKTMRSIYRALKPEGRVVLVEFHREEGESSDWIMNHVRAGQDVFVAEIENAGFEVESEVDFLDTSYFMTFRKSEKTNDVGQTTDSLATVKSLLDSKTAILLDVREQREWDAGHLSQAQLFPLSDLQTRELRGTVEELDLPKDQIIYTHCARGIRSVSAAHLLRNLGYDARGLKQGFVELNKNGFEAAE
ncbi:methyltransferase domain-containing protein [Thalassoglobus sp. JC818]|uniref:methyltransferase domain-containing protein n=1 Tax=Thalassoglobus sp. JC818 TaxID=3232136 RepID=UPI003459BA7E